MWQVLSPCVTPMRTNASAFLFVIIVYEHTDFVILSQYFFSVYKRIFVKF